MAFARSRLAVAALGCLAVSCSSTTPRSAGSPDHDEVTVLLTGDVISLDPNRDVEVVTDSVLFNVFEPLVGLDADLRTRTALAESWEHPNPTQWRFHLRHGVRFHDGTELTASVVRDVLISLRDDPEREASHYLRGVEEIAAVGDDVVDLVTAEPRALLADLSIVYVAKPNGAGEFPPWVGTGPFTLRARVPGERVDLERFDGYWGERPALVRARFEPVPDDAERVARLARGDANLIYGMPARTAALPEGVQTLRHPSLTVFYLGLDVRPGDHNPFADVRVRRALHLAIDRSRIVSEAMGGAATVATQPVAPLVFGYDPDLPRPLLDRTRARELLEAAGWGDGFAVQLDVPEGREAVGRCVREDLAAIGVRLVVNAVPGDALFERARARGSRFYFTGWDCSSGEAGEFYAFCLRTPTPHAGLGNYGGFSDPRIDEIADRNAVVLEDVERQKLLQEAARIAMEELPVLPLFVPDNVYGYRGPLQFQPRADGEIRLLDVRW